MKYLKRLAIIIILSSINNYADIRTTKHNLSSSGPGSLKTTQTSEICIFCHTPHKSTSIAPLWNRSQSTGYTLYQSSTLYSITGQPDGTSKLCLSCHDGTIALGNIVNPNLTFSMLGTPDGTIPTGYRSRLDTDLSDDHPVSFIPETQNPEISLPSSTDPVKVDSSGKMQCTSCHNAHSNSFGSFLVKSDSTGEICRSCHTKEGFVYSSHYTSPRYWNGSGEDPWPDSNFTTVHTNACRNCHTSHSAPLRERLLSGNPEEETCLVCHNGNVASFDIKTVFDSSTSIHSIRTTSGIHDPTENVFTMSRHVECQDCHNPHMVNNTENTAPNVNGRLLGVSGVTSIGSYVDQASFEYEVCIKCHGDNSNFDILPSSDRVLDTSNIRQSINPGNQSYHPIAAAGKSSNVPSLLPHLTTASLIYCKDCHNSSESITAGGSGPDGPHGSNFDFILERQYITTPGISGSASDFALCFKCHDSSKIWNAASSAFRSHPRHLNAGIRCSTCHDPHGVPAGTTEDGDHERLLNFDLNIVSHPTDPGLPPRVELSPTFGSCYVSCHGKIHDGKNYLRQ